MLFQDPFLASFLDDDSSSSDDNSDVWVPPRVRARRSKRSVYTLQDRENSVFWAKYVLPGQDPSSGIRDDTSHLGRKFRRRFRVPFDLFEEIVTDVKRICNLGDSKIDASHRSGIDIRLLVLGSIRYLTSGCTFDAIEELTSVSEKIHRTIF